MKWQAKVVKAGLSDQGTYYPESALEDAVSKSKFGGAPVHDLHGEPIGTLEAVGYSMHEGEGAVYAIVNIPNAPAGLLGDQTGLEVDFTGDVRRRTVDDREVREVVSIEEVHSVTLVMKPATGAEVKCTKNSNWRHLEIGRLRIGFKFGRCRVGFHSMGRWDGQAGLGLATVWWVWLEA